MRIAVLSAVLMLGVSSLAFAQEAPYSQTLDEQLMRVQEGKTPVPMMKEANRAVGDEAPAPATEPARKPMAKREWPGESSATPAATSSSHSDAASTVFRDRHGDMIDSGGSGAIPALPLSVMEQGGVKYLTGGIGDEEKDQLRSMAGDFNVRVLLTSTNGEFISEAIVRVLDAGNTAVVTAQNAGPYFYVNLPPGSYKIEITSKQGGIKTISVKAPAKGSSQQQVRFSE